MTERRVIHTDHQAVIAVEDARLLNQSSWKIQSQEVVKLSRQLEQASPTSRAKSRRIGQGCDASFLPQVADLIVASRTAGADVAAEKRFADLENTLALVKLEPR